MRLSVGRILLSFLLAGTWLSLATATDCRLAADCGWNAVCVSGSCECLPGYSLADNGKNCFDVRCGDESCLQCGDIDTCLRCVGFIERGTGRCMEACSAQYDLIIEGPQMGKVCPEGMGELKKTYLVLIVSVCAGLLLTALICLLIYWRYRMYNDRKARLKFMEKMMEREKNISTSDKHSQPKQLGNPAFDGSSSLPRTAVDVAAEVRYMKQLLAPHREHLLDMLHEAQSRLATTHPEANNSFVYRNIIQQLGRVLVFLSDDDAPHPSDAYPLLQWAHRILTQYLHTLQYTPQLSMTAPVTPTSSDRAPVIPSEQRSRSVVTSEQRPRSVVTSTFRPDQELVTSDSTDNFKYRPCPALISDSVESIQQCREVSEINIVQLLADHNIHAADAVDV